MRERKLKKECIKLILLIQLEQQVQRTFTLKDLL